jgi:thiazole tautomerase (transcriptional regulator TenI)
MQQPEAARHATTDAEPSTDERIPVLHAVTSDDIILRSDFTERARRVMHAGGARVAVHLRAARFSARTLYDLACRLAGLQAETGAWLIVNDRADVALTSGARGLQLTSRSMSPADAKRCAPTLAIGASVHSVDDASAAVSAGVRWIVAGHVFETESHPGETGRGAEFIARLAGEYRVPVIAIGGVRPEHVGALRASGAYGVAAIRGVWHASDAGAAVIDYLSAHGAPGGR